jgi:hypothetical protein
VSYLVVVIKKKALKFQFFFQQITSMLLQLSC